MTTFRQRQKLETEAKVHAAIERLVAAGKSVTPWAVVIEARVGPTGAYRVLEGMGLWSRESRAREPGTHGLTNHQLRRRIAAARRAKERGQSVELALQALERESRRGGPFAGRGR